MKRLWIEEFNTQWIAFGGLELYAVERKGAFVMCVEEIPFDNIWCKFRANRRLKKAQYRS